MTAARSLSAQIEEVQHELDLRKRVYASRVRSGKMRQGLADEHMLRMTCVLNTLLWLEKHEAEIRAAISSRAEPPE